MDGCRDARSVGSALVEFCGERIDSGQRQLAHHIKQQVGGSGNPLAGLLDYGDDRPFLNPSLFVFFGLPDPAATLDQILFGSLPEASRPAEFGAWADSEGIIDLPGWGRWSGGFRDREVRVVPAESMIRSNGDSSRAEFVNAERIRGTEIEYATRQSALFEAIPDSGGPDLGGRGEILGNSFAGPIARALDLLQHANPELHHCLRAVTRQVVTFSRADTESFATLSAHGAVFLSATSGADEVFFIEDLLHQCGHVILNALIIDWGDLFTVDPNTPMAQLTGTSDPRSVYAILHGVFTECLMSVGMLQASGLDVFDGRQRHELEGRLSFIMKRMNHDLLSVREQGIFTGSGAALVRLFEEVFDDVFNCAKEKIVGFDLSNQPYAFSYQCFAELNPV